MNEIIPKFIFETRVMKNNNFQGVTQSNNAV